MILIVFYLKFNKVANQKKCFVKIDGILFFKVIETLLSPKKVKLILRFDTFRKKLFLHSFNNCTLLVEIESYELEFLLFYFLLQVGHVSVHHSHPDMKTWAMMTQSGDSSAPNFLTPQSPLFQHEFPSLSASSDTSSASTTVTATASQKSPTSAAVDSQYGPGPSLRPQSMYMFTYLLLLTLLVVSSILFCSGRKLDTRGRSPSRTSNAHNWKRYCICTCPGPPDDTFVSSAHRYVSIE